MTDFACWVCINESVRVPGEMCGPCFESQDRSSRRRASSVRATETHERTHEIHRAVLDHKAIERESYRRWAQ